MKQQIAIVIVVGALASLAWLFMHRDPVMRKATTASAPRTNVVVPATEPRLEKSEASAATDRVQVTPEAIAPAASEPESIETLLVIHVVDKEKRTPLPGMRVSVHSETMKSGTRIELVGGSRGSPLRSPLTDEHGEAVLDVPLQEAMTVSVYDAERRRGSAFEKVRALMLGERRELVIAIPTGEDLRFFGRMLERGTRAPVARAVVSGIVHATDASSGAQRAPAPPVARESAADYAHASEILTDSEGRFDIVTASWRSPQLDIEAHGFTLAYVVPEDGHSTIESELAILLDRYASLEAHVLDARGTDMPNVNVIVSTESYRLVQPEEASMMARISAPDPSWRSVTESNGRCSIDGLPPEMPLRVELVKGRSVLQKVSEPIVLHTGETRRVEWKIGGGCDLQGRVRDPNGAAIAAVTLWLRPSDSFGAYPDPYRKKDVIASATTDAAGAFRFASVPSGRLWLCVEPTRHQSEPARDDALAPLSDVVEIPDGASSVTHDLTVYRGVYIRGRVVDPSGAGVRQSVVFCAPESREWSTLAQSLDDGVFAVGPLVPGRYRCQAGRSSKHAASDEAIASAGDEGIVLRLHPGARISGRVVDAATNMPCRAQMVLAAREAKSFSLMLPETKPDGTFAIEALDAGVYDLGGRTDDARAGTLRGIEVGSGADVKDLVLTVSPGARIRVHNACKTRVGGIRIESGGVAIAVDGMEAGTTRTFAAPAGHVSVQLKFYKPEREMKRELDVAVGEEREVEFTDDG
jgi:hypothetical protein